MVGEGGGDNQVGPEAYDLLHIDLENGPYLLLGLGLRGSATIDGDADETILDA
jgi:hypothetical protein